MTTPIRIHLEEPDRETRRHRGRLVAIAANPATAELRERVKADPTLARQLEPQQLIALGLYQSALESRQWLRDRNLTDDHQTQEMP